ncbi:MAG: acetyl-CoA carboxylase biotin carboxyl carrier protein [Spirochaetaceae bacterium]|jgi:acetyl-CoA carboxylase biotin carboxyl carrier protein|nr:acetyl-CoA carboxylase biotin carboxyl carrier protein [Spirochaetaceae bacterium]
MNDTLLLTILDKFSESSLAELDLQDGAFRLTLKKTPESPYGGPSWSDAQPLREPTPTIEERRKETAPPPAEETLRETITSPMVATFYASPNPDTPAFVSPGSVVKAGDTLCILEAMKMMNRLEADFDCEILAVHAGNGDLVEYGQVLFEVQRVSIAL